MHFSIKNSKYVFYLLLLILFSLIVTKFRFDENALFYLLHFYIGIISVLIVKRKDCAMLTQASGIFFVVFFSVFPIIELSNEIIYWEGKSFTIENRLLGTSMVFLFVFFFWLTLNIKFYCKNNRISYFQKLFEINDIPVKKFYLLLFFLITLFFFELNILSYNITSLFVKGGEFGYVIDFDTKANYLFFEFFVRPLIFNIGLACILLSKNKIFYKIFILFIILFAASPSGISRFLFAALYIPLLMIALMSRYRKKKIVISDNLYLFPILLLIGFFFIFPLIEIFRNFSFEKFGDFSYDSYQLGGSFDAFQMFLRALEVGNINFGYGFLGTLFFFIPRSIWPSKPVGSGLEISQLSNLRLENVSMPIIGELYLNFWYFGIFLGSISVALLFKKIDSYYLRNKCCNLSLGHLMYFQLAVLVIVNFRGGILSTFAYTVSILTTWILIFVILVSKDN
jgi:oligosaccharide repeat unit polymerase